jgi:hypothetical protein
VTIVIEYTVEPLAGGRGQLHVAVFKDGEQVPELCHPWGSPAPIETVRRHERTVTFPTPSRPS